MTTTRIKRTRKHTRIRARIMGTAARPRISVFRSGRHLFVQLIDDTTGKTLLALSDAKVPAPAVSKTGKNVAHAFALGKMLAASAKEKGVSVVVFDRGGYAYHGRVRAVAEGAREGGLQF